MLSTVWSSGRRDVWTVPKFVVPSSLMWCLLVWLTVVLLSVLPLRRMYVLCSPIGLLPMCRFCPGLSDRAWMLKAVVLVLSLLLFLASWMCVAQRRGRLVS